MRTPTSTKSLESLEKRKKAMELRMDGKSYRAIAAAIGVSVAMVGKYLHAELAELREANLEKAEEYREIELARLEKLTEDLRQTISEGMAAKEEAHELRTFRARVVAGEVEVPDVESALREIDRETLILERQAAKVEKALETSIKVSARRSALLGLDAPTKQEVMGEGGGPLTITVRFPETAPADD